MKKKNKYQEIDCSKSSEIHPTSKEMKEFAGQFSKGDWNNLCYNSNFISAVLENLSLARKISRQILKKSKNSI
jgi:hypothetical protein